MEYEEINPQVWKPENAGDQIEGRLKTKSTNVGVNNSNTYHIETKTGIMMVWGSTILDMRLEFAEVGEFVKITYKGKEKNSKNQDVNIFKVEKEKKVEIAPEKPDIKEENI